MHCYTARLCQSHQSLHCSGQLLHRGLPGPQHNGGADDVGVVHRGAKVQGDHRPQISHFSPLQSETWLSPSSPGEPSVWPPPLSGRSSGRGCRRGPRCPPWTTWPAPPSWWGWTWCYTAGRRSGRCYPGPPRHLIVNNLNTLDNTNQAGNKIYF